MKPARLRDLLLHLSAPDLLLTLLYVLLLWSRHHLRSLRPSRLIFPAALAHITTLIVLGILELTPYFFIASIFITALFILPSTIKRPRYHWIR